MKDKVLGIVQKALFSVDDDLYRANTYFGGRTEKEMELEYGQSGETCREVLHRYLVERDELRRCVEWVKSAT